MIQKALASRATAYSVHLVYPAPFLTELDDLLDQLATKKGGHWFAAGSEAIEKVSLRKIQFQFGTETAAKEFAAKCSFLIGVQVLSVERDA